MARAGTAQEAGGETASKQRPAFRFTRNDADPNRDGVQLEAHVRSVSLPAQYYQQFDADLNLDVPAEGYGGWKRARIDLALDRTAVVVMHAWETGASDRYPGWYRAVECLPRAQDVLQTVFPKLLSAVRSHGVRLFHVVGGGDYYKREAGYQVARRLAGEQTPPEQIPSDPSLQRLQQFKADRVFVGAHNQPDVRRAFQHLDFPAEARPISDEGIAKNAAQGGSPVACGPGLWFRL